MLKCQNDIFILPQYEAIVNVPGVPSGFQHRLELASTNSFNTPLTPFFQPFDHSGFY